MNIYKSWAEFKNLIISKNLLMQYHEYDYHYIIFASETSTLEYYTEIWKDTSKVEGIDITQNNLDLSDWENNYKTDANKSAISTDGKMQVNVSGSVSLSRFRPKFYISKTEIILTDTDQELANICCIGGKMEAISILFDRADTELSLYINDTEIFRETLSDLSSTYALDISAFFFNFPILVSNNGKQIIIRFASPPSIDEGFKIKARRTTDSTTKMKSIVVSYREAIS